MIETDSVRAIWMPDPRSAQLIQPGAAAAVIAGPSRTWPAVTIAATTARGTTKDYGCRCPAGSASQVMVAEVARLVEPTTRRRRHAGAGTQRTSAHLAGAEQAVIPRETWDRAPVALMPQWRQDHPNKRPPTWATAISEMGQKPAFPASCRRTGNRCNVQS